MLVNLSQSFNIEKNLTEYQIEDIVAEVLTDIGILKTLTVADFYLILKEIKTGKRQIFQCLDAQVVLSQINDYLNL